jgi:hypothetical protein
MISWLASGGVTASSDLPSWRVAANSLAARRSLKWLFDVGSAQVVGGATVALSVMLGTIDIQQEVCIAFAVLYLILFFSGGLLLGRLEGVGLGAPGIVETTGLIVMGLVVAISSLGANYFPLESLTAHWWEFVGLALFVAMTGEVQRRFAESAIEDIDRKK